LEQVQIDSTVKPLDYDFVLRLAATFPFAISKKPCALFMIHSDSYSLKSGLKLFWPSWQKIAQNLEASLAHVPSVQLQAQKKLKNMLKKKLFRLTVNLISRKQFDAADQVIGVYRSEFEDVKALSFLTAFFRRHSYLTFLVSFGLKLYRSRQIFMQLKLGKFTRNLIDKYSVPRTVSVRSETVQR
jgi:hypothetical protein